MEEYRSFATSKLQPRKESSFLRTFRATRRSFIVHYLLTISFIDYYSLCIYCWLQISQTSSFPLPVRIPLGKFSSKLRIRFHSTNKENLRSVVYIGTIKRRHASRLNSNSKSTKFARRSTKMKMEGSVSACCRLTSDRIDLLTVEILNHRIRVYFNLQINNY